MFSFFQALLNWCTAQVGKESADSDLPPPPPERKKEAVREKLSKFLEFIKWENMSGEEFVELASSDVLSLEQYRTFSLRIFRANFKGRRSMTREMSNPLRVYRKAIPCPSVKGTSGGFFMRGNGGGGGGAPVADNIYDASGPDNSPSPRTFHTFRFPHITVEVETTPQCVQFKHELEPQSQLCLNFKTMLLLANSSNTGNNSTGGGYNSSPIVVGRPGGGGGGRIQVFASVILENQVERSKSVFKRMRIADTNSLVGGGMDPLAPPSRFAAFNSHSSTGKKLKTGQQHHGQEGGGGGVYGSYSMMQGNFFQGSGHAYHQLPGANNTRRTTPPIRQNMFLIPITRYVPILSDTFI